MSPDEARDLFSAAYDGELAGAELEAFQKTLSEDSELGEEWNEFKTMLDEAHSIGLDDDDDDDVPDLLGGVQHKLRVRSRGRFYKDRFSQQSGGRSLLPILIGAAMLLIVVATWLMMQQVQVEDGAETTSVE